MIEEKDNTISTGGVINGLLKGFKYAILLGLPLGLVVSLGVSISLGQSAGNIGPNGWIVQVIPLLFVFLLIGILFFIKGYKDY